MVGKIKLLLLFFTLVCLPLGEVIRLDLPSNIAIKPLDIGVGLIVIFWIITAVQKKVHLPSDYAKPLLIFLGVALLSLIINMSTLTSQQFLVSLLYPLRWAAYVSILFVIVGIDDASKNKIKKILIAIGASIVIGGYFQLAYYSNLRNLYYLGWDEHMHRMFSSFLDPNFAGAFFVLYLLFLIGQFMSSKRDKARVLYGLLSTLTLGAVYLTYSRSALIMLFVGVLAYLIMIKKVKWMIGLVGISIIVFLIFSRNFSVENTNLLRVASSEARLESAKNALVIFQKNPILGVGFNAYRYAQIRYGMRLEKTQFINHADAGTDNSFLFVLATTGIVGFMAFAYFIFVLLKRSYIKSAVVFASIVGLLVDSLFINSLFYTPILLWLWTLIGVTESK